MINIVSDDSYFALGAQALLTQSGFQVAIMDSQLPLSLKRPAGFQHDDVILLSSDNRNLTIDTLLYAVAADMRVIQSVAGNISSDKWIDGVLPKKTAIHELPRIMKYILRRKVKDWLIELTLREMEVMDKLLKGKSNHAVSKEMQISEKTVSSHKLSALKKLGLSGLNSRAIVIYGSYHNLLQQRRYY
ncbi:MULTISPECIES: helix-turn-helix transcriptional regulator [unclassified Serratia (in: enterobacteria)]|uniref:response regulator transcription factor n=1 Tax=unclassified Serratia (in: enterobacteria) TaxID=2647522 RepID=UPI00046AC4C2|nr:MULTISPECIES: helix-turn-helix transcriptional regulator [unclassified Serratia (in: enterobacteria)]